jgi:hypothetical protein
MIAEEPNVCSVPTEVPGAERAKWLAELAEALNEAHDLVTNIDLGGGEKAEVLELYIRIEAARLEVQSLRLSRSFEPRRDFGPEWTRLQPWLPSGSEWR